MRIYRSSIIHQSVISDFVIVTLFNIYGNFKTDVFKRNICAKNSLVISLIETLCIIVCN